MKKPLEIVSASAGSGKTYHLVLSYLRILFQEQENPIQFNQIIAMTFTNKAASEMKERITKALHTLSLNNKNEEQVAFLNEISSKLALDKKIVERKARTLLSQILHRYEDFNISTIDKFNLKIIKSFAKELNIQQDFQTTTETKEVLEKLVDNMLLRINNDDRYFTEIAVEIVSSRIQNEERWDFKSDLLEFISELINEKNQNFVKALRNKEFSTNEYDSLKKELIFLKQSLVPYANHVAELFSREADQSFDKTNYFKHVQALSFDKFDDNPHYFTPGFYTKLGNSAHKNISPELQEAAYLYGQEYNKFGVLIFKTKLFLDNYFFMHFLKIIQEELDELKKNEPFILINEFNFLINHLLENENTQFIYEKIGNRFQSFLLDEFQDTSRLQWKNLTPLIHESISKQMPNLIVGDAKQSIYRFKNGLAEQFVSLPKLYNPENELETERVSAYFDSLAEKNYLSSNWRSNKDIVKFNNDFFKLLKEIKPEIINEFYHDVHQDAEKDKEGYIEIYSNFTKKKERNDEEIDIELESLNFVYEKIKEAKADGYDYGDLCILAFRKKQNKTIAEFLIEKGLQVVSNDSLLISSNADVQLILSYIAIRANEANELYYKKFLDLYAKQNNNEINYFDYWKKNDKNYTIFQYQNFIKEHFDEHQFYSYFENIYQLITNSLLLLKIEYQHSPYILQFLDIALEFDRNQGQNIVRFLEFMEAKADVLTVNLPKNKDAIELMTAHKSKGLEFPIVIAPNLNMLSTKNNDKHLVEDAPYFYYTSFSSKNPIPLIKELNEEEKKAKWLDAINLLYVVFTRAKDRLYLYNESTSDKDFPYLVHFCFKQMFEIQEDVFTQSLGKRIRIEKNETEEKSDNITLNPTSDALWYPAIVFNDKSQDYFNEQQKFGDRLHLLLAKTDLLDQVKTEETLTKLIAEGEIENEFKPDLIETIQLLYANQEFIQLLDSNEQILKEQDIIIEEGKTLRPDLLILKKNEVLIVDYKSGKEENKHKKQLIAYKEQLKVIYNKPISTYLCYLNPINLIEVK